VAHSRPLGAGGDARPDHHRDDRTEPEHDERVAEGAVAEAPPPIARPVLADGERGKVADATSLEVAGAGVVHGMVVAPARERCQYEEPKRGADDRVGALGRQQRTVRAVMEDHKGADQEPTGRDRERQS
jgi:hypothetical protein